MEIDSEKLLMNLIEKRKVFWEPIVAAAILLLTVLGVMVPLYMHSDNANRCLIEGMREESQQSSEDIRAEMKDFHHRMYALELRRSSKSDCERHQND